MAAHPRPWLQVVKDNVPSRLVLVALATRLLLYGNIRVLYPLKNFIAEDWGISSTEMNNILAAGELSSIGAGVVGSLGDRYGNRAVALGSWAMVVIFSCIVLCPPSLELEMVARIISSLFATVFMVATQSAVVAETDPSKMGFVTGISESGWGFSILALVPILTVIYESGGWRAMWGTLCGLMIPICFELWFKFPEDDRFLKQKELEDADQKSLEDEQVEEGIAKEDDSVSHTSSNDEREMKSSLATSSRRKHTIDGQVSSASNKFTWARFKESSYYASFTPGPVMFNLSSLILNIGHNLMFLAFTDWASIYYDVDAESMGVASFGIGAAELAGDICVILFSGRIGLLNTIYIAGTLFAIAMGMFILAADHSFGAGVALAAILFMPGEAMIVSQIALAESYVVEKHRTTMLAMNYQCHFLGRAIGAFIADAIWNRGEVFSSGLLGVCSAVIAVLLQFFSAYYIPSTSEEEIEDLDGEDKAEAEGNALELPEDNLDQVGIAEDTPADATNNTSIKKMAVV